MTNEKEITNEKETKDDNVKIYAYIDIGTELHGEDLKNLADITINDFYDQYNVVIQAHETAHRRFVEYLNTPCALYNSE